MRRLKLDEIGVPIGGVELIGPKNLDPSSLQLHIAMG